MNKWEDVGNETGVFMQNQVCRKALCCVDLWTCLVQEYIYFLRALVAEEQVGEEPIGVKP